MRKIPAMVSMQLTDEDRKKEGFGGPCDTTGGPIYPYGLSISLTQVELDKLGLSSDVKVGEMLHIHAMSKVTSVSTTENEKFGVQCRIELQITDMVGEDEDSENTDGETRRKRLYG